MAVRREIEVVGSIPPIQGAFRGGGDRAARLLIEIPEIEAEKAAQIWIHMTEKPLRIRFEVIE